jgi:hypothetical protein
MSHKQHPGMGDLLRVKKCASSLGLSRAPQAAVNMRNTVFILCASWPQALPSSCAILFDLCCASRRCPCVCSFGFCLH